MSGWCQQAILISVQDSGLRCKVKAVNPFSQIESSQSMLSDHITFTSCLGDGNKAILVSAQDSGLRHKVKPIYPFSQTEGCHSVLSNYITLTSCLGDGNKLYQHLYGKWSQFILSPRLKVVILYYPIISLSPHVWVMSTSYTGICTEFWTQMQGEAS